MAICEEVAPHWLAEARAIAEAAGVRAGLYTAYIGCVYRSLFLGDECTSYAVSKDYTKDGAILFHKNRDNKQKPQAACIVAADVRGVNKFITVTDASVLACMMMVNAKGLAGSADTGGAVGVGTPKYRGMMNTFVLRHIAERAESCHDALDIIKRFVEKGWYAGGGGTGTHWLFVDKKGHILEVSNNADKVVAQYHDEKVYFSVRGDTPAADALRQSASPIDFQLFHNVSRDPSICFDGTIAGMTVEIDPEFPGQLTCAWISFPASAMAFPLFLANESTAAPLVDGTVDRLCRGLKAPSNFSEKADAWIHASRLAVATEARALLRQGKTQEATEFLNEWTRHAFKNQMILLEGLS